MRGSEETYGLCSKRCSGRRLLIEALGNGQRFMWVVCGTTVDIEEVSVEASGCALECLYVSLEVESPWVEEVGVLQ